MSQLTIPAGDTHTISSGERKTHSPINISGELNLGGELNVGSESEVPLHILDHFPPERMAMIVQSVVNHTIGIISEIVGEIPPIFGGPPATNLTS